MICNVHDLGLIAYQPAWDLQNRLALQIAQAQRPNTLLLLEHTHTYTFGRRAKAENLLWDAQTLARRAVAVHWVDRGGDVTYHGPGQLVGYPLLRLPDQNHVGYVRRLEKMLIAALARLGLPAMQFSGQTGVWLPPQIASRCPRCQPADLHKPAKIAAIGVKVDAQGVTRHGFALNVDPCMEFFDGIIPCGLVGQPVVSLAEVLPQAPAMPLVKQVLIAAFADLFDFEMVQTGI